MGFLIVVELVTGAEGEGVEAHLLHHGYEAVGARGGEILGEAYAVDEVKVGVEDFLRGVAVEHLDKERDDAFDDDGVGVGGEIYMAVALFGVEPHAALATFDEMVRGFVSGVDGRERVAEVDDHCVAVHPVVEVREFLDYFVLGFVDCHIY